MAKNVLPKHWNGSEFEELHIVTKASNVFTNDNKSVQQKIDDFTSHLDDYTNYKQTTDEKIENFKQLTTAESNKKKPDGFCHPIPITGTYVGTVGDNVCTITYKNSTTFTIRIYSLETKKLKVQSDIVYGTTITSSTEYGVMGEYDGHLFLIGFVSAKNKIFKVNIATGQLVDSLSLSTNKIYDVYAGAASPFEGKFISKNGFIIVFNSNWNFKKYSCVDFSLIAEATIPGYDANATRWDLWVDDDYFYLLESETINKMDTKRIHKFDCTTLAKVGATPSLTSITHDPYEFVMDDEYIYYVCAYYASSTDQYTYIQKVNKATMGFDSNISDYLYEKEMSGQMLGVSDNYVYASGTKGIQIYDKTELAEVGYYPGGGSIINLNGISYLVSAPSKTRKKTVRFTPII